MQTHVHHIVLQTYPRKLRTSEAGQLLLNLSFAMLGIYVMFIVCLHAKPVQFCAAAGSLLHYFMLAAFFLMAAEAVNLYLKLVIVLGIPPFLKNRYVLKAALLAWSKWQCCDLQHMHIANSLLVYPF